MRARDLRQKINLIKIVVLILGISGNVGGVGFAMLFLVLLSNMIESKNKQFHKKTKNRGYKLQYETNL